MCPTPAVHTFQAEDAITVSFQIGGNSDSDAALLAGWIKGIKDGDQQAAAELVRHYEPEVRRFVRFRLTEPRLRRLLDSVDVFQSVMARFFHRLQADKITVEHPLQLLRLLITMARNSLLDHARKAKVRRNVAGIGGSAELDGVADPRTPAVDLVEQADLVTLVRSRLKVADQQLLDRWLLGGGWDELSKDFACEPDALRKRLTRAIDRATQELGLLEESDD